MKKIYLIHALVSATISVNLNVPLSQLCSQYQAGRNNFVDKIRTTPVLFDPIVEFNRGIKLGEGSFGIVKRVPYPSGSGVVSIALKEVESLDSEDSAMIAKELAALAGCNNSDFIPKFYGCSVYSPPPVRDSYGRLQYTQKVYIALELLSRGLDSSTFKRHITTASKSEALTLFGHMFRGLMDMNTQGLAHNDIKPANMMANADMSRVYLIDLGLASDSKGAILMGGTPFFMPPNKFLGDYSLKYKPIDDMYSIALSIAELLSKKTDEVWAAPGQQQLSADCVQNNGFFPSTRCRNLIVANVKRILSSAGYGDVQSSASKDTINFTTLITRMVVYDGFTLSVNDVIKIIERLIGEIQEKVEARANEAREEARRQEARIQELERQRRMRQEYMNQKRIELENQIKQQEAEKKKMAAQPQQIARIDKLVMESQTLFQQEEARENQQIDQYKREAEQLIKNVEQVDKAHLKEDQFFLAGFKNFGRQVPPQLQRDGGAQRDPILRHYRIQNEERYDLAKLIPGLKRVKDSFESVYDRLRQEEFVGDFVRQRWENVRIQEKMNVDLELIAAEIKEGAQRMQRDGLLSPQKQPGQMQMNQGQTPARVIQPQKQQQDMFSPQRQPVQMQMNQGQTPARGIQAQNLAQQQQMFSPQRQPVQIQVIQAQTPARGIQAQNFAQQQQMFSPQRQPVQMQVNQGQTPARGIQAQNLAQQQQMFSPQRQPVQMQANQLNAQVLYNRGVQQGGVQNRLGQQPAVVQNGLGQRPAGMQAGLGNQRFII